MPNYNVNFIVKDWVTIRVDASDENSAKEKAEKKLNKGYKDIDIDINDGKTKYAGFTNNDIFEELGD